MDKLPDFSREDAIRLLQQHGISPTRQRLDIALVLFSKKQHLSADQIQEMVNLRHAYASKATIYNTLRLFVNNGLLREVLVDSSKVFYDSNTDDHHHFYDVGTGRLTDIGADKISINALPELPAGMVAEGIDIVVRVRQAV